MIEGTTFQWIIGGLSAVVLWLGKTLFGQARQIAVLNEQHKNMLEVLNQINNKLDSITEVKVKK